MPTIIKQFGADSHLKDQGEQNGWVFYIVVKRRSSLHTLQKIYTKCTDEIKAWEYIYNRAKASEKSVKEIDSHCSKVIGGQYST